MIPNHLNQQTTLPSDFFEQKARVVEQWLDRLLPIPREVPATIHEAMRYSVFAGGKRLRPILCIAAADVYGAPEQEVLPAACALEMIHTYSLIHDDLPAMDDDTLRRGRPTCHVVYGEAIAILAGDALLTRAFSTLAENGPSDPGTRLRVIRVMGNAAGTVRALIGGQVLDLESQGKPVTESELEEIHRSKTGALITCAVRLGAIIGGASDDDVALLTSYGEKAGLAFQVADDILDQTAPGHVLGKTPGKDSASDKATYVKLLGLEAARKKADALARDAVESARLTGRNVEVLETIARRFVERKS
jgi:geranylgeranyl diphosphate synthase type II